MGAAALVVRLGWVLYRQATAGGGFEFPDEGLHWELAVNLARDGNLVSDDGRWAARMPLYPLFLAPFAALGELGPLAARCAQALVGAATAAIAFAWLDRAAGRSAAWIAGALVALDPFAVFFAQLLLTEVLFTFVTVAFCAVTWTLVVSPQRRAPVAWLALLAATLPMIRPSSAAWIPLVLILLICADRKRKRAAQRAALVLLAVAAALLPWGLRNRAVIGAPAWLSANGGVTLYDALGPQADGSSDQTFLQELPALQDLGEAERDRWLRDAALAELRADPARALRLAGTKIARLWNPLPNYEAYRGGYAALAGAAYSILLYLGALAGLYAALAAPRSPRRTAGRWLVTVVVVPLLYFTAVHAVYIGSLRYRVPLMPLLAAVAALGVPALPAKERAAASSPSSSPG